LKDRNPDITLGAGTPAPLSAGPRLLLLQMPWATTTRPSIALAILTRLCEEQGVPVRTHYANLDLAAAVGIDAYGQFSDERDLFGLSEHLFAADLFGPAAIHSDEYLEAFSEACGAMNLGAIGDLAHLRHLRDAVVPAFLECTLRRLLENGPDVVGFTGTFNQVMSSLALAHRVKQARPQVQVIVGGASFDGEMGIEYHRALPDVIDHVFLGEAEESFAEYLRRLRAGADVTGIPGVTSHGPDGVRLVPGAPLQDLNASPLPDYDDFFRESARVAEATGIVFNVENLPFESARGCWWGEKNHCMFCGINEDLMRFRAKDVERVIRDIVTLSARHQIARFCATDWIVSHRHCDELFRRLKELDLDLEIFYEVRPSLKKRQVRAMSEAGVVDIQPGIESFSTPLLKLMAKHGSGIRNVQFLRWCREAGIRPSYNLLTGFPGERAEWYREMAELVPRLVHLDPPLENASPIEMHRFAPLHERHAALGVDAYDVRADYWYNFPPGLLDVRKVAYFFDHSSRAILTEDASIERLREAVARWLRAHREARPPVYHYAIGPGFLKVTDTREGCGRYLRLAGLHHDVTLLCDEVRTRRSLSRDLGELHPEAVTGGTLDRVVDELLAADVLMADGEQLLTLPVGRRCRVTEDLRAYVLGGASKIATSP
jgi:ribosomal peptide maturation radical SAM protein 1